MTEQKKKQQRAMTVEEQLENLKNLGLIIEDEREAIRFLNDVSYFRFIKAYSAGLKPKNGSYQNTSFNELKELYLFNSNFRHILFIQIEKVEVNLRCRIANYYSNKYGVLGYLNSNNYNNIESYYKFLTETENEIARNSRSPFIKNFKDNYENEQIPFYALTEIMSFGMLSKFFKNLKSGDKKRIAKIYNVPYTYLESWFENIAYVRNVCAHYGRLYNAKMTKTPRLYPDDLNNGIKNIRVFATLFCIKKLINNDEHWVKFIEDLDNLFNKYPHVDKTTMDFPANWKNILLN